jgi:hypothetical protein
LEEVQELLPDEVVKGILSAELSLDLPGRLALFDPDFSGSHWIPPSSFPSLTHHPAARGLGRSAAGDDAEWHQTTSPSDYSEEPDVQRVMIDPEHGIGIAEALMGLIPKSGDAPRSTG